MDNSNTMESDELADVNSDSDLELDDDIIAGEKVNLQSIDEEADVGTSDGGSCSGVYSVNVFMLLVCLFTMTHGFAINGVNNVNIPMYERRFHLTSSQTGLLASFYDITSSIFVLFLGYIGTRFNQPRLIAIGLIALTLGSMTMALPHFLTGDYQPKDLPPAVCLSPEQGNLTSSLCESEDRSLSSYLFMFLFGQSLHGVSGTLLYTIAPPFIDGSVSNRASPLYIAIFYSTAALGPGIGYILGGYFLGIYVDTPLAAPEGQTPQSPGWVGAWWIGFLATSAIAIVLAFPLFTYPKILPGTAKRRRNNEVQAHGGVTQPKFSAAGIGLSCKDIPMKLSTLLRNPVFVCQCLTSALTGFNVSGLSTFTVKFLTNQFNQETGWAAMLMGIIVLPAAIIGQLSGGYIVKKFDLRVKAMVRLSIGSALILVALSGVQWLKCEPAKIAGVNVGLDRSWPKQISLSGSCNEACACDTSVYDPVCIDGIEFMSPCLAGCPLDQPGDPFTTNIYHGCSCALALTNYSTDDIPAQIPNTTSSITRGQAWRGRCGQTCSDFYIFIPFMFVTIAVIFFPPATNIILRCVHDEQRTLAIAIRQFVTRLFGTIPGPLVYGLVFDRGCMVWQETCGQRGSCWIYDSEKLGLSFMLLGLVINGLSAVLFIVAHKLYKLPNKVTDTSSQKDTDIHEDGPL